MRILNPQVLTTRLVNVLYLKKKKGGGGKAQPPDMLLLNKIISKCETDVTSVSTISTSHFAKNGQLIKKVKQGKIGDAC